MESPNRTYVRELDELRGLAALLVLFYHSVHTGYGATGGTGWLIGNTPVVALLYEGHTGVGLFMVLSGFVLARGMFGRDIKYRGFIVNRALRILPLMTFVLIFGLYGSKGYTLSGAIAPFLFLANTPLRFDDATHLSGAVWTISVEFQFYLIAPFLIAFTGRGGLMRFVLPAMLLVFLARLIAAYPNRADGIALMTLHYNTIVGRLSEFLLGIALAYVLDRNPAWLIRRREAVAVLVVSLAGIILFTYALNQGGGIYVWHSWRFLHPEIEGLFWAGVIGSYIVVKPARTVAPLQSFMTTVGVVSFSMYLLHWPIQLIFWDLYKTLQLAPVSLVSIILLTALVLLPVVLAASLLSYHCIERPFLHMRKRYVVDASGERLPLTA